jgi:predicted phage-related endonuclease
MATVTFDTLAYSKKLRAAGVPEKQAEVQAEAFAEIIEERLATKQDIVLLQRDIKTLETDLKRDMKEMEMRLTIRLGVMMAGCIAVVATLVKIL